MIYVFALITYIAIRSYIATIIKIVYTGESKIMAAQTAPPILKATSMEICSVNIYSSVII